MPTGCVHACDFVRTVGHGEGTLRAVRARRRAGEGAVGAVSERLGPVGGRRDPAKVLGMSKKHGHWFLSIKHIWEKGHDVIYSKLWFNLDSDKCVYSYLHIHRQPYK